MREKCMYCIPVYVYDIAYPSKELLTLENDVNVFQHNSMILKYFHLLSGIYY